MTSVPREFLLSYAVRSEGRRCGSASAVHEPSPAGPPYQVSSITPAGPSARATPPRRVRESSTSLVRLHLKRARRAPSSSSRSTVTASSACAIATASLRPRPDRRATRRLCRRGRARPGEAGRWNLESRAKGLAVALRPRGRARPERPHRRRTRIQQWMPGVEWRESPCRCPGDIQVEMLASTVGCRHPVADDGVAVE